MKTWPLSLCCKGFIPGGIPGRLGQERGERLVIYAQVTFFLLSLGVLLVTVGYQVGHIPGVLAVVLFCLVSWLMVWSCLPGLLLKRLQAVPMDHHARAKGIVVLVEELARRSAMTQPLALYYAPSSSPNAFVARVAGRYVICLTAGLLAMLSPRELAAVLAHEVSHVRANHTGLMVLSTQMVRLLLLLTMTAQVVWWGLLPVMWATGQLHAWLMDWAILLLPTIASIVQLALCRRCELAADRQAVLLTGDPGGLMAALRRLDGHARSLSAEQRPNLTGGAWLCWLRSHPSTRCRLEQLQHLRPDAFQHGSAPGRRLIDHLQALRQSAHQRP